MTKYDQMAQLTIQTEYPESQRKIAAYLRIFKGPDIEQEQRLPLYNGSTVLGSATNAVGLYIKGRGVSGIHAIIEISQDCRNHFIQDMNSTNGTFIGNHELASMRFYQILDTQEITLGPTKCRYEIVNQGDEALETSNETSAVMDIKDSSVLEGTNSHKINNSVSAESDGNEESLVLDLGNNVHSK